MIGFAALFAAIWIMHRPLDVHASPIRCARFAHRVLEWTLTAWGLLIVFQIYCLISCGLHTCSNPNSINERHAELIERNREVMRRFETCINTNDLVLGEELISPSASFLTPVSPTPLQGASGYPSVVAFMRRRFPDVQWKLENMVADETTVAVQWQCSGTFCGDTPFAGIQPNGRKFSTTVMNFYTFDAEGRIVGDVAATGIAGILQGIGALPSN